MSAAMMNTPSSNTDAEHAHNMPKLVTRVEGRGNGLKTCIVNINQVACVLKRPPQYAAKFLGHELGTSAEYQCSRDKDEGGRITLSGIHDSDYIQSALDEFIEAYVVCRDCDSVETTMKVGRGKVSGKCMACGWTGSFVGKPKVTEYMVMNPPDASGMALEGWESEDESKLSKEEKRHFKFLMEAKYDSDGESTWYPDSDDELSLCVMEKKARKKSKKGSHDDSSSSSSVWGLDTDEEEIDDKDVSPVAERKKEKKEKKDKKDKKEKKEKKEKKDKKDTVEHELDVGSVETGDDLECSTEKPKKCEKKSKKSSSKGESDKNDLAKDTKEKNDPEMEAEVEAYLESVTEMFKGCRKKKANKDKKDKKDMDDNTEQALDEEVECTIEKIKEYDKGDGKPSNGRKKSEKKDGNDKQEKESGSEPAEDTVDIDELEKMSSNDKADKKCRKDPESKKEKKDKKEKRDKSNKRAEKHGGEDVGFKEETLGPKVQSKEEDKAYETHQSDWDASAEGGKKGSHGQPEFAAGGHAALPNPLKTEKEASEDEGIWDEEALDEF